MAMLIICLHFYRPPVHSLSKIGRFVLKIAILIEAQFCMITFMIFQTDSFRLNLTVSYSCLRD